MENDWSGAERLISLVFSRRQIWDKKAPNYVDKEVVEQHWCQIANELGYQKPYPVKRKWKSLRDTFLKEMKKVPAEKWPNLDVATYELYGAWPFFSSMLFLRDFVRPRTAVANTTPDSDSEQQQLVDYDTDVTKIYDPVEAPAGVFQIDSTATGKNRTIEEEDDEDEMFFSSLLPHVCKLAPEDKLAFRTEIMNMVQKYVYHKRRCVGDYSF
ncbi:uncharacterized protein LOC129731704 [Wyeomyia smithii]|uniref:uncharacterized protein LOC129731704 n=1 Tax=Wyeomyia smithii TaxID=174621 RepID=UPI002467CA23|nr:uncharacterized protein LOC129731704 [Wyeomyia smithii]